MKIRLFLNGLLTSLTLSLVACQGPTGLLPGGTLEGSGAASPAPPDWTFAGASGTIQLETNPSEPYSVNLAYTVLNDRFFINAGGTETQWAKNIAADPKVRLLLESQLYDLLAERITDPVEIEAFAEAWTGQSFFRRDPRKYLEVWIFELVRR
jgi:hypothetical protein